MSAESLVKLIVQGPIATLCIDNPPLNVLTIAVRQALLDRIAEIEGRPDIRVLVLASTGERAFSVGSDIREFPETEAGGVAKIRFEQMLLDRLEGVAAVTIARIGGLALGGGGELMLACDFRIAALGATIGFPEIRLGALPAAGGMKRLVRELGAARAREIVLLGKSVEAATALRLGLINVAVPADRLDDEVRQLADELAALPASTLRRGKAAIAALAGDTAANTIEAEAFGALFRTADLKEGLAAFLEKRPPRFNR